MNETIHEFELAGLGQAPFRHVGFYEIPSSSLAEANPDAYNARLREIPRGYHVGTCSYCGHPLVNNYLVESFDGRKFAVGSECILKVGDAGLKKAVNLRRNWLARERRRKVREAEQAKERARYEAAKQAELERNGGFMDAEFDEATRFNKKWTAIQLLTPLARLLDDGRPFTFRSSVANDLRNGELPTERGQDIAADILAKQCGRRNSKAYNAEYDKVFGIFEAVEEMRANA